MDFKTLLSKLRPQRWAKHKYERVFSPDKEMEMREMHWEGKKRRTASTEAIKDGRSGSNSKGRSLYRSTTSNDNSSISYDA
ncbi:hypothetical protein PRZ48_005382 [Zasmidium cellare]|uniref:Uncharacterized protein n=1 Tax=Zasmidium cellare TaxID=395010 RepID=A0ABR0ES91_ZASCE|nr:hypothetical protein PRZ48_005382 [Zasmidium cellare]